jgi:hypothetical protein
MSGTIHTHGAIYAPCIGSVDYDTDSFKMMLSTSSYTPDKDHDFRDDVTNEVTGTGYTAGGAAITVSVTKDTTNDRVDVTIGAASWSSSTIAGARNATAYKARGGASSADELILTNRFSGDLSTSNGTLSVAASTLRFQN